MPNMSYCRFENTLYDLRDCYEHMDEAEEGKLSKYELEAFVQLIELCMEIADMYQDCDNVTSVFLRKDFPDEY